MPNADLEAIKARLKKESEDYSNSLLGLRKFPDTGRTAESPGETYDSYMGAPVRQGISELQDGNVNMDALKRVWSKVGADPKGAPTGVDLASKVTSNPYVGTALATGLDLGAQVPVSLIMPGAGSARAVESLPEGVNFRPGLLGKENGLIPQTTGLVKNPGTITDAPEAFKARGQAPQSVQAKDGDVLDFKQPETNRTLEDNTPNADWNKYVKNLDDKKAAFVQEILNLDPRDHTAQSLLNATKAPSNMSYVTSDLTGYDKPHMSLPNFDAKPSGQIGEPGISHNYGNPEMGRAQQEAFPEIDKLFGAGKQLLQRHQDAKMPVTIHTSSDLLANDDYLGAMPNKATVNIYKGSNDPDFNGRVFPGNPNIQRLYAAARHLNNMGIKTNLIEPTVEQIIEAGGGKDRIAKLTGIKPAKQEAYLSSLGHLTDEEMANKPQGSKLVRSPDDRED